MTHLFATHLLQKSPLLYVLGQYDPEQELWVADNQLQGMSPWGITNTTTGTGTSRGTTTWVETHPGIGTDEIPDSDKVPDTDPDTDTDEY